MNSLDRRRHKEVKRTSAVVERQGAKPKEKYMEEVADRREEQTRLYGRALAVVIEAAQGRLNDDEVKCLASVFVTEQLAFQYFEDEQYPWAIRLLTRQEQTKAADIVKRAFM